MLEIFKIDKNDLRFFVKESYIGDQVGLDKFHIKKFTLDEAVDCTMDIINEQEKQIPLYNFGIFWNGLPIGYSVISKNLLYSFCINIKYRTKEIILQWWNWVKEILGNEFYVILEKNNTRAVNFLKKRGMKVVYDNNEDKTIILKL